ncbi:succinate--CoA ligase subunit alpha, partial [Hansschlegelia zhihuaiae]
VRVSPSPARLGKTLVELLKGQEQERPRLVAGAAF